MRVDSTPIGQAMIHDLKANKYKALSFNTYFKVVTDTPGYQYIRLAKVQQDTNTGSIQLNIMSLSEDDLTKIVGKVLNKEMV